jgi:hypothetical protein
MRNKVKAYHVKWDDGEVMIVFASDKRDLFSHVDSIGDTRMCEIRILENFPTLWTSKDGLNFDNFQDECSLLLATMKFEPQQEGMDGLDKFRLSERRTKL